MDVISELNEFLVNKNKEDAKDHDDPKENEFFASSALVLAGGVVGVAVVGLLTLGLTLFRLGADDDIENSVLASVGILLSYSSERWFTSEIIIY